MSTTSKILVSGLINFETTLRVDSFPVTYEPARYPFFGVNSTVSGVGYNIAKALNMLDSHIHFLSIIGQDLLGQVVQTTLAQDGLPTQFVRAEIPYTAQSVIIYNSEGKRQIHTDLKDLQERHYPAGLFSAALAECDLAVLCNINYNRPFLAQVQQIGKPIATDVHTIADLDDHYNHDFMVAARILFMSNEKLPCTPEEWARRIFNRFGVEIVAIGLGSEGVLLGVRGDNFLERVTAVATRPVVNTIGAGDALFSAFVHFYHQSGDPYDAIQRAVVFASYKIGETGAAMGFLTAVELEAWLEKLQL